MSPVTKQFSIMVFKNQHEIELCRCGSNPEAIVEAAQAKTKRIEITTKGKTRWVEVRRYNRVWFVEHPTPCGSTAMPME
jgi:hypothetical protein